MPVWLKWTDTVPPESVIRPSCTCTCAGQLRLAELLELAAFGLLLLEEPALALALAEPLEDVFAELAEEVSALAPWAPVAISTAAARKDADPNTSR